jgi:hypothetical protein
MERGAVEAMMACTKCKAAIVFVKSARGRSIPCDPELVAVEPLTAAAYAKLPKGERVIVVAKDGSIVRGRRKPAGDETAAVLGRVSHFGTCPFAESFRNPRRRA